MESILRNYQDELNGANRKDVLESCEKMLAQNIELLSVNEEFYKLPLTNILIILTQTDFTKLQKPAAVLYNICKYTIGFHGKEDETILLLTVLNTRDIKLSHDDIIYILSNFSNSDLLTQLCDIYRQEHQPKDAKKENAPKKANQQAQGEDEVTEEIEELTGTKPINGTQKLTPEQINEMKTGFKQIYNAISHLRTIEHADAIEWLTRGVNLDSPDVQPYVQEFNLVRKNNEFHSYGGEDIIIDWQQWLDDIEFRTHVAEEVISSASPFHNASKAGLHEVVDYICSHGYDINSRDREGKTPLHIACENGQLPVVEYLVTHGCDVNSKDYTGKTPLHYASINGQIDIAKCLLANGADKDIRDEDGFSPFFYGKTAEIKGLLRPDSDY